MDLKTDIKHSTFENPKAWVILGYQKNVQLTKILKKRYDINIYNRILFSKK